MGLTSEQREAYDRDGAVLLPGVVSADWLERLAAAIERDIAAPGPFCHAYVPQNGEGRFHGNLKIWQNDPVFREFCLESPLPALAAELFAGTREVRLLYDQLFVKEPGTTNRTRWHNDQPYWPVSGWQVASFWLALDPVGEDNGRLEFVRGSHRWDRWFQPEPFAPGGTPYERGEGYEDMPDIDADPESYPTIGWDMKPGDVVAFHAMTVHGAGGNSRRDRRRRGYTVRYCGDDATYYAGTGTSDALKNAAMQTGDPIESDRYPLVWTR